MIQKLVDYLSTPRTERSADIELEHHHNLLSNWLNQDGLNGKRIILALDHGQVNYPVTNYFPKTQRTISNFLAGSSFFKVTKIKIINHLHKSRKKKYTSQDSSSNTHRERFLGTCRSMGLGRAIC